MKTMQYRSSAGSYLTENRTYNNRAQLRELISTPASVSGEFDRPALANLRYFHLAHADWQQFPLPGVFGAGRNAGRVLAFDDDGHFGQASP
jgi:hypothetical protein